jgi:hypothetical protein
MRLTLTPYQLELAHTFSISRESHDFQDSLIVTLSHEEKVATEKQLLMGITK